LANRLYPNLPDAAQPASPASPLPISNLPLVPLRSQATAFGLAALALPRPPHSPPKPKPKPASKELPHGD